MTDAPRINYNNMVATRAGDMGLEQGREKVRMLRKALLQITAIIETQSDPDIDAMHDIAREALNN